MSSDGNDPGAPPPFRVRFSGQTFRVKDETALRRLVQTGKVPAGAVVQRPGQTAWLTLDQVFAPPEPTAPAAEVAADPWSAWSDLDDEPAVSRKPSLPPPKIAPTPPPPKPPEVVPVVFEPPRAFSSDPEEADETEDAAELPAAAAEPIPSRVPPKASPGNRGKVIPFPGPRPGRRDTDGSHALAPEPLPFPERPPPAPPPPMQELERLDREFPARRRPPPGTEAARTNWWRIGFLGFLGVAVLSLARLYVTTVAQADFGPARRVVVPPGVPDEGVPGEAAAVAETPPTPPPAEVDIEAAYREVESQLRASMMAGTQPTGSAAELETALFLELNRVRLSVIRVDVAVLATRDEVPDGEPVSVELRVLLRSDGTELDREIAAAAMVIGKYVQGDGLSVPTFEVAFDGLADGKALRTRVDADLAREFYAGRLRMGAFLQAQTR